MPTNSYDRRTGAYSDDAEELDRLRGRISQEVNKIVRGAGKVIDVETRGPSTGFTVVFDTEYAALKAFHAYRGSPGVRFGKAAAGGWFISLRSFMERG